MVSAQLLEEYKATSFIVFELNIIIYVNEHIQELDKLLMENHVISWAFITAYNPTSKVFSYDDNVLRHQELIEKTKTYKCFEGEGRGRDPKWKPERSLLILGITNDEAIVIGNYFQQNAIVVGEFKKTAELLI
ncbi:MAG: DUF3293 domain-containing protein [Bacteroidota bacterium]|nr:DUF3293 domain-containing protein [Bacteroidota bacterium]